MLGDPRNLFGSLATAAVLLTVSACGGGGGGGGRSSSGPVTSLPPITSGLTGAGSDILVGAWVDPPGQLGTPSQNIAALETQLGRHFDISLHYDGWTSQFPSADELVDRVVGRIPEVSWNCGGTDSDVAAGRYDSVIAAEAAGMVAYHAKILLRYKWEFNDPVTANNRAVCFDPARDAGGFFDPTAFVAAWQHIHAIFVAAGATNVVFLWNADGSPSSPSATPYWPGDAFVDWIGIDAYDGNGRGLLPTLEPGYDAYENVGALSHPFIVGETGALPANQTTFLKDNSRAILAGNLPQLRALTYFDAAGPRANWTFSSAGFASFKAFADDL